MSGLSDGAAGGMEDAKDMEDAKKPEDTEEAEPSTVTGEAESSTVIGKVEPKTVTEEAEPRTVTEEAEPRTVTDEAMHPWEDSPVLNCKLGQEKSAPHEKGELRMGGLEQALPEPNLCYEMLWRDWEDVCSPVTPRDKLFDFHILSYNILSQDLISQNPYLYLHCPPDILAWEYRWPNLLRELQHWDADVLCLQEVQEDHYRADVQPSLSALGYSCHYKRRTGRKMDGCVSCFKAGRFRLLQERHVEFFRPGITVLNRDNVGLLLLLQPIASEEGADGAAYPALCVANTHLLYNPRRGDIKLAQLAVLLAEVERLSHTPDGPRCPIILCGDLNATPLSPLYRLLHNGFLNCSGLSSWEVSGQEQDCGLLFPRPILLPLWPDFFGVTDQCQYKSLRTPAVKDRRTYSRWRLLELRYAEPALQRPPNLGLIQGVTDNEPDPKVGEVQAGIFPDPPTPVPRTPNFLQHHLQLTSAYHHFLPTKGRDEVTTLPLGIGSTVDYIFYSAEPLRQRKHDLRFFQDGQLKLLGRLCLLSEDDLRAAAGLPNPFCSSDHIFLLARFSLDPAVR